MANFLFLFHLMRGTTLSGFTSLYISNFPQLFVIARQFYRTGDIAKSVARSLSSLGFSNTWVVADGFDGGKGWIQSRLGTESYNLSYAEVLSPTRIIPAGTRRFFSSSSAKEDVVDVGTTRLNRLLPGGFDE
jgi:hypothetical protein